LGPVRKKRPHSTSPGKPRIRTTFLKYMTKWQHEMGQNEVIKQGQKAASGAGRKKQNPAVGGICYSQLVLVTQTLPKSSEVSCPQKLLSVVSLSILFRENDFFIYPFSHCLKSLVSPLTVPVKTGIEVQPLSHFASLPFLHKPARD
jgi:hypothetical protein